MTILLLLDCDSAVVIFATSCLQFFLLLACNFVFALVASFASRSFISLALVRFALVASFVSRSFILWHWLFCFCRSFISRLFISLAFIRCFGVGSSHVRLSLWRWLFVLRRSCLVCLSHVYLFLLTFVYCFDVGSFHSRWLFRLFRVRLFLWR